MEEVNSHLGVKNHDPDARPPRYGQQRAEEVLGCKMSGWLTPKLVGTEKLWGFPLGTGALCAGHRCNPRADTLWVSCTRQHTHSCSRH
jgi:hypothetical protein